MLLMAVHRGSSARPNTQVLEHIGGCYGSIRGDLIGGLNNCWGGLKLWVARTLLPMLESSILVGSNHPLGGCCFY